MAITVHIGKVPGGDIKTIELAEGASMNDALDAANLDVNANSEVRMSGVLVEDMDTPVVNGSTILITDSRVKNN